MATNKWLLNEKGNEVGRIPYSSNHNRSLTMGRRSVALVVNDNNENGPVAISKPKKNANGVLTRNTLLANSEHNQIQTPTKAPKKQKKVMKASKRFKIFGSMKKASDSRKESLTNKQWQHDRYEPYSYNTYLRERIANNDNLPMLNSVDSEKDDFDRDTSKKMISLENLQSVSRPAPKSNDSKLKNPNQIVSNVRSKSLSTRSRSQSTHRYETEVSKEYLKILTSSNPYSGHKKDVVTRNILYDNRKQFQSSSYSPPEGPWQLEKSDFQTVGEFSGRCLFVNVCSNMNYVEQASKSRDRNNSIVDHFKDDDSQISELSMISPASMKKEYKQLDKCTAYDKSRFFCNFAKLYTTIESSSDCSSSKNSNYDTSSSVEISVDPLRMLPSTSSLSYSSSAESFPQSHSEGVSCDINENDMKSVSSVPSYHSTSLFPAKKIMSLIRCKIFDCFVPAHSSPPAQRKSILTRSPHNISR